MGTTSRANGGMVDKSDHFAFSVNVHPSDTKLLFGERLRRGRLMRGLSLRGLASRIGEFGTAISHAALQKYEKGLMGPDSGVLLTLSRALNLDPGYFFRSSPVKLDRIEFRKLTKFPLREVNRLREEVTDYIERYRQVEAILEIRPAALMQIDLRNVSPNEGAALCAAAEKAARQIRAAWKLGETPLTNVHELLEEHGVKVKMVDAAESFNGFCGWADDRTPVITLAKWLDQDLPRKRLTALHELGHLVLNLPSGISHKAKESYCYRFAGALLLPADGLLNRVGSKRPDGISLRERVGIKEDWGISIAALMRRSADLGIITQSQLKSFHVQNSSTRKNEPGLWQGSERADRYEQLVFRAAAQELVTRSKATELLGITAREFDQQFAAEAI
ncbi:MAG TPA: XRE family transcriptional regulator [Opitutaceae bacterium]|nr:XRE family transcriptional regulator [Opitutaceae bacterium]